MKKLITLLLALSAPVAHAGGAECQLHNSCQCLSDGTCDKFGNPIPSPVVHDGSTIFCGGNTDGMRIVLEKSFDELPQTGQVPAKFFNVPMPIHDYVTVSTNPIFHTRGIHFETAYCGFTVQLDTIDGGHFYVLRSTVECEGQTREIQCQI